MIKDTTQWNEFLKELTDSILPLYEKHEKSFDFSGIHGRLHISRSIIFAEFMARFYSSISDQSNIDFSSIRYSTAFHDSGRKDNGIDLWEKDSEDNCYKYLYESGHNAKYCKYTASLIGKKIGKDINHSIVYDSDVIEIMRPCCGHGGIDNFNRLFLNFLSEKDILIEYGDGCEEIRNKIINDAWKIITYTEDNKHIFSNDHIYKILDIIKNDKLNFEIINKYF
jgi:hypothetical protein